MNARSGTGCAERAGAPPIPGQRSGAILAAAVRQTACLASSYRWRYSPAGAIDARRGRRIGEHGVRRSETSGTEDGAIDLRKHHSRLPFLSSLIKMSVVSASVNGGALIRSVQYGIEV